VGCCLLLALVAFVIPGPKTDAVATNVAPEMTLDRMRPPRCAPDLLSGQFFD
jgi:hypothetical protein